MIFDRQWYWVFMGLFSPAFMTLFLWRSLNWRISFSDEETPERLLYISFVCSGFAYIATGLLKMLHRLLTRGRNGGRIRLPEGSWQSRIRIQ
ncbi:hypothetical protein B0H14DRAFT_2722253 [Mycena olivaceomarginata]|nr:hypothetical protein B0H14DRAFT_2722253 [Mycena olivaceomarginata]